MTDTNMPKTATGPAVAAAAKRTVTAGAVTGAGTQTQTQAETTAQEKPQIGVAATAEARKEFLEAKDDFIEAEVAARVEARMKAMAEASEVAAAAAGEEKSTGLPKFLLPSAPGTFIFRSGYAYYSHDGVVVPTTKEQLEELEAAERVGNVAKFVSTSQLTPQHEIRDPAKTGL